MKLLQKDNHAVLIFGLGVVGFAIFEQVKKGYSEIAGEKLNWASLEDCKDQIDVFCKTHFSKDIEQVDIIWSAGNTLFSADKQQTDADLKFFKALNLALSKTLRKLLGNKTLRYILISSAGGLFEGQTSISASSKPAPKRPYAELKLAQEDHIKAAKWIDEYAIVRLSSVYTISNLRSRMGLIPIMVSKAIKQEFISIYGTEMTIRDYVLDTDIGRYIAGLLGKPLPETVFVVDGKPHSIVEIKNMVEAITQKKVYLKYTLMKSNAENNSYARHVRADGFEPSDLATNIRLLYYNLLAGATL